MQPDPELNRSKDEKKGHSSVGKGIISANLFVAGLVSTTVQLLLIRESLNISGGYELTAGLFFGIWLIASAAGARSAPRLKFNNLALLNIIFILSPLISLANMVLLSVSLLSPGETPSFLSNTILTLATLFPFCFVSGFLFIKLLACAANSEQITAGTSFARETAGGIIAGLLVAFLTSGLINTYEILILVLLLSADWTIKSFYVQGRAMKNIVSLGTVTLIVLTLSLEPDEFIRQLFLPAIKVEESLDTPYGNITTGSYGGQQSLYYNHRLRLYGDDIAEREEDIHYAMLQSATPGVVTLIAGTPKSHVPEILKYGTAKVIFVETDPELAIRTGFDSIPSSLNYEVVKKDGYRYIMGSEEKSDLIIILVPPPSTLLLGRYFSSDFFSAVKERLNEGGVFVCSPGQAENYYNKESIRLYSSVYKTLRKTFRNVMPLQGNKLYFIASDSVLSTGICRLANEKRITNTWVSPDFLSDDLIAKKSEELILLFQDSGSVIKASSPSAVFYFQMFALSRDLNEKAPAIILLLVLFALPALSVRRTDMQMYISASALAGFEIVLLLALQITAGNMYQMTGLIIAGVLAGLAIGSHGLISFPASFTPLLRNLAMALFYAFAGALSFFISSSRGGIAGISFLLILSLPPAIMTGNLFRDLTSKSSGDRNAALVYSSDLAGSAAGFIITATALVPLLGITITLFLFSGLILLSLAFGTKGGK